MKTEIAKYKIIDDADCDVCHGYFDTVYEFVYTATKPGDNVVRLEHIRFCRNCLDNVRREFGDDLGAI